MPVHNGGYCNNDEDSLVLSGQNILGELQEKLKDEDDDKNKLVSNNLYKSYNVTTKEDEKQTLFQYKIVDRDSDVDVIEGLGNTTIKSKSLDGSNDEGDDGAPFNKSVVSPPKPALSNNQIINPNQAKRPPGK